MFNYVAIKPELWSRDHYSTLLYLESCAVDRGGKLDDRKMRTYKVNSKPYPTLLSDGTVTNAEHDDWSCIEDMIAYGLIDTAENGNYVLTDLGWEVAHQLRKNRANNIPDSKFNIRNFIGNKLTTKGE